VQRCKGAEVQRRAGRAEVQGAECRGSTEVLSAEMVQQAVLVQILVHSRRCKRAEAEVQRFRGSEVVKSRS
jgi:hypothetical protein